MLVAIVAAASLFTYIIYRRRKEKAEKIDSNQLDTFLREGHLTVCHARCIIVGCAGAGKTTLLKRLQGMSYRDVREKTATKLVDVYVNRFEVLEKENTIQNVDNDQEQELPTICFYQDDIKSKSTGIKSVKKERESQADLKDDCIALGQYVHPKEEKICAFIHCTGAIPKSQCTRDAGRTRNRYMYECMCSKCCIIYKIVPCQ